LTLLRFALGRLPMHAIVDSPVDFSMLGWARVGDLRRRQLWNSHEGGENDDRRKPRDGGGVCRV
jgi:hypothetical protein